MGARDEAPAVV